MLVRAVVVAGNRSRTDVDAAADCAIADVTEMVGFAVCGDLAVFDFDEIADVYLVVQPGTGAQPRVGTDVAVSPHFAAVNVAVWCDVRTVSYTHLTLPTNREV